MNLLERLAVLLFNYRAEILYVLELDQAILLPANVPVRFRLGSLEDLNQLEPSLYDFDPLSLYYCERRLSEGDAFVLAEVEGEVVSYCWLCFGQFQAGMDIFWPAPTDLGCIYKVFTRPDMRGKSIYPATFNFLVQQAREWGLNRFTTSIKKSNLSSRRSVEKVGFKENGRILGWRWGGKNYFRADTLATSLLT